MSNAMALNGLTAEDLAQTAYTTWHRVLDTPTEWEQADPEPWLCVARAAIVELDKKEDDEAVHELSASKFAADLHGIFCAASGLETSFADLARLPQLAWEAVGRHLLNAIDCEPDGYDLAEFEGKWRDWALEKMS